MLAAILEWSLRHRAVVVLAWIGIAAMGVVSALRLPLDAFPDTTPVQVQVNVGAPALSPLEIERQITAPLEWAISGLPRLAEVRSVSKFGFSQISVTFEDGTDVLVARQLVMERVQTVELPPEIARPTLGPVSTGLGEVFHYLVLGRGKTAAELRTIQQWAIAPQLRAVPGVAEVNSWGGDERQVQVIVDPAHLQRFDLTLEDLVDELETGNANVGGGTIERAGEAALVQGVGIATSADDVAAMVVASREGVPVRVRDVARVVEGREIRRGAVTAMGRGEVVLGLGFMSMGENSRVVTERLRTRLEEIRRTLPRGVRAEVVYDRTDLVAHVLRTVEVNLLEGALLVVIVLFAFLGSARAGIVVAVAIPLSMAFASNLMLYAGVAGSLMSLGAIDFGLVVDSAVIQVENVVHRLGSPDDARPRLDVVRDAVHEVRRPTLFGELVIAIVYLPILLLEGIEGKLFRPMALTVLFALAGSMLLSLTLVPVLASVLLPRRMSHRPNVLVRAASWLYRPVLRFALRRPWIVIAVALVVLGNGAFLATRLGSELVPRLWEGTVVLNTVRLAGISLDESVRYGTRIEQALLRRFPDEIERIWTRTGSPEVATDPMGIEVSDVFVQLRPRERWRKARSQDELVRRMSAELESMPGMRAAFTQPIEMRMNEMIAGIRSDLGVKLFGEDFETLRSKARVIERVLRGIRGAEDVTVEQITGLPIVPVAIDRTAVGRHGVRARDVLATVEALGGRHAGEIQDGERRFPIAVRLDDRYRSDVTALGRVLVASAGGERVPLRRLAKIGVVDGPAAINREWGKRRVVVQANVRGRDLGGFVAEARRAVDAIDLPDGYYVRYGGQFEHLESARLRLAIVVPAALLLIFVLLYFTYGRAADALRVFSGVPFALVGGVVALLLRDMPFSISAAVGFVALAGVSVLGDMVLVSRFRQLVAQGLAPARAIEDAAASRLRPVLMTALVASLGFVPMALSSGVGAEVQRPLATVVIGGVVSSTLLTLVVLPALYALLAARDRPNGGA
ncbi:MAG: efflux RND transporter permease subunit [Deltaproteobacteria bacterium]|nr:efflux RND transporter permease subunit [Deltaproteobacteria bacterium]